MTTQKSFKRRVRARMTKTGESYAAARRQLLPQQDAPAEQPAAAPSNGVARRAVDYQSAESLRNRTGRGWDEWFAILDADDATKQTHTEIARKLVERHGVEGWWAQSITVAYEQERGLRLPGQRCDGFFDATASKTVAVPLAQLYAAVADPELRSSWLDAELTPRGKSTEHKVFRAEQADTPGKVEFGFTAKGPGKSQVAVAHSKLPDAEIASKLKAEWRDRLATLKSVLEA